MIVIVFGVSGAGKTTVGELLARELDWHFLEADDFHPAANIEDAQPRKLSGLTDEDRAPWLERLREQIKRSLAARENALLACSALKRKYRERLRVNDAVKLVFLRGSYAVIAEQLRHRRGHFFDGALLKSQFDDLEEPQPDESALTIELGRTPQELVKEIKEKLHLSRG